MHNLMNFIFPNIEIPKKCLWKSSTTQKCVLNTLLRHFIFVLPGVIHYNASYLSIEFPLFVLRAGCRTKEKFWLLPRDQELQSTPT